MKRQLIFLVVLFVSFSYRMLIYLQYFNSIRKRLWRRLCGISNLSWYLRIKLFGSKWWFMLLVKNNNNFFTSFVGVVLKCWEELLINALFKTLTIVGTWRIKLQKMDFAVSDSLVTIRQQQPIRLALLRQLVDQPRLHHRLLPQLMQPQQALKAPLCFQWSLSNLQWFVLDCYVC